MFLSSLLLRLAAAAVVAAVYFDFVNSSLYVRNVSSFVVINIYRGGTLFEAMNKA